MYIQTMMQYSAYHFLLNGCSYNLKYPVLKIMMVFMYVINLARHLRVGGAKSVKLFFMTELFYQFQVSTWSNIAIIPILGDGTYSIEFISG